MVPVLLYASDTAGNGQADCMHAHTAWGRAMALIKARGGRLPAGGAGPALRCASCLTSCRRWRRWRSS